MKEAVLLDPVLMKGLVPVTGRIQEIRKPMGSNVISNLTNKGGIP
jgi:hypothetical protein